MERKMKHNVILGLLGLTGALLLSPMASAADAAAAEALAKKEGCLKCHAIDKKKEAKSLKEISAKYKGKADSEAKILHHLTSGEKVKLDDGTEEEHKMIKSKDKAEISNMINWILSLK
jgi:cytochrome c